MQAHCRQRLHEAEQQRANEVSAVLSRSVAAIDHRLTALGEDEETGTPEAHPRRSDEDTQTVLRWAAALDGWTLSAEQHVATFHDAVLDALESPRSNMRQTLEAAGIDTIENVAVAGEGACSRRAVLADRLTRAEADLVTARECESRVSTIEPLLRALEQLSRYLQNNEFKHYLMRRRERHLLGVATDILRRMTDDRYAFAERFQILDGLTQQTRDARTLSGGEKFLASLAVALALVEIASQASEKLDALFSDEGFGSLDGAALDAAVAELAARASFGKMIRHHHPRP